MLMRQILIICETQKWLTTAVESDRDNSSHRTHPKGKGLEPTTYETIQRSEVAYDTTLKFAINIDQTHSRWLPGRWWFRLLTPIATASTSAVLAQRTRVAMNRAGRTSLVPFSTDDISTDDCSTVDAIISHSAGAVISTYCNGPNHYY